ncbi:MAG: VOC family protein [Gammaproteobacteria bacterium]|nr:VOC family protein [Gammaproteobacteria bacterium]
MFGVAAIRGGSYADLGTCNALLSFGDTYLEIIAPDPKQPLDGNFGGRLQKLKQSGLITWCARGELNQVAATLKSRSIDSVGPVINRRQTPSGEWLEWQLLFPRKHPFGGQLPFFIDWMQCAHPARTNPLAGALRRFEITTREAQSYRKAMNGLVPSLEVSSGAPFMKATVDGPRGVVELATNAETVNLSIFG